ncbi:hypothetical protein AVEN_17292-1 [Araneus ventricosus]|uniref:Uncharacterized protein n=1 Tax=Araneus ventricosus TaxID=182803 RepID=A0A4Y2PRD3_ARAVE|nr:hypothetical protein AVEN_17292-1 [Araneus ventricosus]
MAGINNDLNDKNLPSEDTSPRDTGSEVDSSSFETLQNLAEASLDRLEESVSDSSVAHSCKHIEPECPNVFPLDSSRDSEMAIESFYQDFVDCEICTDALFC